ncbi:MAG: hypothetical protein ABSF12_25310, partial [Bryobacteraceae bacterium]
MLPIMDKLFGTWYMPKKQWPSKYGIDAPMAPGLTAQLLEPFERRDEIAERAINDAGESEFSNIAGTQR